MNMNSKYYLPVGCVLFASFMVAAVFAHQNDVEEGLRHYQDGIDALISAERELFAPHLVSRDLGRRRRNAAR